MLTARVGVSPWRTMEPNVTLRASRRPLAPVLGGGHNHPHDSSRTDDAVVLTVVGELVPPGGTEGSLDLVDFYAALGLGRCPAHHLRAR